MGRKNLVYNFKPIGSVEVPGDMSVADIVGTKSNVAQYDAVTYEISWSGGQATNGNLIIEYTKDPEGLTGWRTLPLDGTPVLNGAEGSHLILITEIGFNFLRPHYERTNVGATGSLEVNIFQTNKGA